MDLRKLSRLSLLVSLLCPLSRQALLAQCEVDTIAPMTSTGWGYNVVFDGTRALVPVVGSAVAIGAVYIYERGASGWALQDVLQGSSSVFFDGFAGNVAIDGDTIAVSAQFDPTLAQNGGAIYVFERIAGAWVETAKLFPSNPLPEGSFACSLDLDGERIVAGAPCTLSTTDPMGLVHVFAKSGGTWSLDAVVQAAGLSTDSLFGSSVALSGDTLLVGARLHAGVAYRSGAAFVFERIAGSWVEQQTLGGSRTDSFDQFGISVALVGQLAVVGAFHESIGTRPEVGASYVFERQGGSFVETQRIEPENGRSWARHGRSVRTDGTSLSILGTASRPVHLYRRRLGQFELAARLRFEPPYPYAWEAELVGDTALISGADTFVFGNGIVRELHLAEEVRIYCDCGDRAWCPDGAAGCDNSIGAGARVLTCGTTSVASDELVLTVDRLPPNQFGLVFMGAGATRVPFGDGYRCVSPAGVGIFRFPVRSSGAEGAILEGPGLVAYSQQQFGGAGVIDAGETWNFQAWFRDPVGPYCGDRVEQPVPKGFGLSNAVEVLFRP